MDDTTPQFKKPPSSQKMGMKLERQAVFLRDIDANLLAKEARSTQQPTYHSPMKLQEYWSYLLAKLMMVNNFLGVLMRL